MEGKVKFVVDQSVKPVKMPLRRIPLAVKEDVEEELLRLEKLGVITRETRPTDWVSGMVVAKKPSGKLRICLDPKPLNKALKRSHFPSTVLGDILPELGKAKCFSICDITSGYWHIQLDEESSLLTTFATRMGRFRWQRLPFVVSVAPELFQERLEGAIAGLKGVCTIVDDMIVWGEGDTLEKAQEDHDENLQALMRRCQQKGIKLNREKFKYRLSEVTYVGHKITSNGIKSDPTKVSAICKFDTPKCKADVQRLLGMVNFLAKF